jgi:hypothetical protein
LALVDANYKFTIIDFGGYGLSSDGGLFTRLILGKSQETNTLNIPNSKPPPNSEEPLPFVEIYATTLPRRLDLNDESRHIYNYILLRARRFVESAVSILTQKFRLLYGRIQLSPENAEKIVLAACVSHSYLRNYVIMEGCVIENSDVPSQFSYVTTFHRSGGSASGEALRVRKKYRQWLKMLGHSLVSWKQ